MASSAMHPRPQLGLKLDYSEGKLRAELDALAGVPGAERKAIARALNRALLGTRTDITSDLRARTVLAAGVVRKGMYVRKAFWRASIISGGVTVDTTRLPLSRYKLKPARPTAMKGRKPTRYKHLAYSLTRDGKSFDNAPQDEGRSKLFVVRFKSGHLAVVSRLGSTRTPIAEETGPSLQFFVSRQQDQTRLLRGADLRFRKELSHQVTHLGGGGK